MVDQESSSFTTEVKLQSQVYNQIMKDHNKNLSLTQYTNPLPERQISWYLKSSSAVTEMHYTAATKTGNLEPAKATRRENKKKALRYP